VVFEEDPAKFPFGSFRFQNFSPQNVAAEMGGETFVVKPGSGGRLIKNRRRRTVFFIFQTTENGTPRIQLRSLIESEAAWNAALDPGRENQPGTEKPLSRLSCPFSPSPQINNY